MGQQEQPGSRRQAAPQGRSALRRRRRRTRRLLLGGAGTGVSAVALAGAVTLGWLPGLGGDGVDTVTDGQLTVCTELSYMPFEFEQGGRVVGFDVDVVTFVAQHLGLSVEVVDTPFPDIVSGAALDAGRCDVAASAVTATDERRQVVDFSSSYFTSRPMVVVAADSPVRSEADLAGVAAAAATETTGEQYAQELGAVVTSVDGLEASQQALVAGTVDAVVADNGVLLSWVSDHPEFRVAFESGQVERYGVVVRKGDGALLAAVDEALAEAHRDGRYDEAYRKWFAADPSA